MTLGLRQMDASHIACAVVVKADYTEHIKISVLAEAASRE
jgi:hypothetical protein